MKFVAVDVETANADMASICQIGVAQYENGALSSEWRSYVDPQDYFDEINISIHGINESMVKGAPNFEALTESLYPLLNGQFVICHTHFDRVAISQAAEMYEISPPECVWLDSARIARRTWEEFAWKGYGLYNICESLGYEFKHHDALEDAKATGKLILAAIEKSGLDIEGWLTRVKQPIDPNTARSSQRTERTGNPEGPFYGEVLVFTGALKLVRREAADLAASVGCEVASSVTKKTTMLVVSDQDIRMLAGQEKSSKHRRAEGLIAKGASIRILKESDFEKLVQLAEYPEP